MVPHGRDPSQQRALLDSLAPRVTEPWVGYMLWSPGACMAHTSSSLVWLCDANQTPNNFSEQRKSAGNTSMFHDEMLKPYQQDCKMTLEDENKVLLIRWQSRKLQSVLYSQQTLIIKVWSQPGQRRRHDHQMASLQSTHFRCKLLLHLLNANLCMLHLII